MNEIIKLGLVMCVATTKLSANLSNKKVMVMCVATAKLSSTCNLSNKKGSKRRLITAFASFSTFV